MAPTRGRAQGRSKRRRSSVASGGRGSERLTIRVADSVDREAIYRIRHAVYAEELGQHRTNAEARLSDDLDAFNTYIVAERAGALVGFISVTPPGGGTYSIDKYVPRKELPFSFDDRLYEIRLLTVIAARRRAATAVLLMYAAFRWIEARAGSRVIAIGRREVLGLYRTVGLETLGRPFLSGAVTYEAMTASTMRLRTVLEAYVPLLARLERSADWKIDVPFYRPAVCSHGGAFFDAVGDEFDALERRRDVINADVLDAWFPPSPGVLKALNDSLDWIVRTSPPTDCGGLVRAIARARGVPAESILPGAGSSNLIFLAFRMWLENASRVLVLDPSYGEYGHVLERVVGCRMERLELDRSDGYSVDPGRLRRRLREGFDLVVLVNPNSPTGRHIPRKELEEVLGFAPITSRIWIDETYVDYVGAGESLETFAARSENVFVCKSMSKAYALSGVRVAYLCAPAHRLEELRAASPPWAVSLPGQIAAVEALRDPDYYTARYDETRRLRDRLAERLCSDLGMEVVRGTANFLLAHLSPAGPDAATVEAACRRQGLYLRDVSAISPRLGRHALRIAVKDAPTNERMATILSGSLNLPSRPESAPHNRLPAGTGEEG